MTLPMNKFKGFSDYAQPIGSRYRLKGLPDPTIGSDFTQEPDSCNLKPELLKSEGKRTLSLFRFCRLTLDHLVNRLAYSRSKVEPDSSPALKCGVFSDVFNKL